MTDFPDLLRTVTALEIFRAWRPSLNDAPGLWVMATVRSRRRRIPASTHKGAGGGVRSLFADVGGRIAWFALQSRERPCSKDACSWPNEAGIGGSPSWWASHGW